LKKWLGSQIVFLGMTLRAIILAFLAKPETNPGPINSLLWIDQINGLLQVSMSPTIFRPKAEQFAVKISHRDIQNGLAF